MVDANQIIGAAHDNVQHDSAVKHVTGEAIYIDDMPRLPNTLECILITSPIAHAKINSIDTTKALSSPGVLAALSAADIIGKNDVAPVFEGEPILAIDCVEYVGHPIIILAAETYDQAYNASKLVEVEYTELEPILTIHML